MRCVPQKANDSYEQTPSFAGVSRRGDARGGYGVRCHSAHDRDLQRDLHGQRAHWVPVDVNVIFSWPEEDTDAVATVSPDCQDGAFHTITAEGDQTLHCDVTYVNGDTASGVAHLMIDKTAPVASGAATTSGLPIAFGWLSAPFQIKRVWTDALSGVNTDNCDLSPDYSGAQTDALGIATPQMDCYDKAGNHAVASGLQVKFDTTGRRRRRHPSPRPGLRRLVHAPGLVRFHGADGPARASRRATP